MSASVGAKMNDHSLYIFLFISSLHACLHACSVWCAPCRYSEVGVRTQKYAAKWDRQHHDATNARAATLQKRVPENLRDGLPGRLEVHSDGAIVFLGENGTGMGVGGGTQLWLSGKGLPWGRAARHMPGGAL